LGSGLVDNNVNRAVVEGGVGELKRRQIDQVLVEDGQGEEGQAGMDKAVVQ
jgi:hypothetical protein